jgi:hypothetical protein
VDTIFRTGSWSLPVGEYTVYFVCRPIFWGRIGLIHLDCYLVECRFSSRLGRPLVRDSNFSCFLITLPILSPSLWSLGLSYVKLSRDLATLKHLHFPMMSRCQHLHPTMLLYHRRVTESALIHQSWRTRKGKWKIMDTVVWFPQEATSQIKGKGIKGGEAWKMPLERCTGCRRKIQERGKALIVLSNLLLAWVYSRCFLSPVWLIFSAPNLYQTQI